MKNNEPEKNWTSKTRKRNYNLRSISSSRVELLTRLSCSARKSDVNDILFLQNINLIISNFKNSGIGNVQEAYSIYVSQLMLGDSRILQKCITLLSPLPKYSKYELFMINNNSSI